MTAPDQGETGGDVPTARAPRWRLTTPLPRLGIVLLLSNLVVLALPLSGLWLLRLYESAMIRQTEAELIAQGAVIAAAYRDAWRAAGGQADDLGAATAPGRTATIPDLPQARVAVLDLALDPVLPLPPDPAPADRPSAPAAAAAGARITPILAEAQRVTLAGVRVVDPAGTVVATTGDGRGLSLAAQSEVARALTGEPVSALRRKVPEAVGPGYEQIGRGADLRVFVTQPILEADRVLGAVVLSRTPRTLGQALYGKRIELMSLALVLLGLGAAIALVVSVAVTRPLGELTRAAQRIAVGDTAALRPRSPPRIREIATLTRALSRMADTLDRRATYIRGFAAEVSHEFKTPLTAIRGAVELLREDLDLMSATERRRFLDNVAADADRLDRLVRRLLELARADVAHAAAGQPTPIGPLLTAIAARWRDLGFAVALDLDSAGSAGSIAVAMAPDVVETVFGNLLDNVRHHAGAEAAVTITLRAHAGAVLVEVADDGPGISPANAGRVFDRFFTTARKAGGTGLGLTIVQSLMLAHGGAIALVPRARGACFALRFPAAALHPPI